MRFIWFSPGNQEALQQGEQPTTKPLEVHANFQEHQKDLADYLKRQQVDKLSANKSKEYREFLQNLENWDLSGNVEALRTAGRTEQQNLQDGLAKHAFLSSAFLQQVPGNTLRFIVNFKENRAAYWKLGAGDLLPPTINKIRIYKPDGSIFEGTRGYDHLTHRIGYFDKDGSYLPIFSNDEIEVLETLSNPGAAARRKMSEHVEIYQNGVAGDQASVGSEMLYDAQSGTELESPQIFSREKVKAKTEQELGQLKSEVLSQTENAESPIRQRIIEVARRRAGVVDSAFRTPDVAGGKLACAKVVTTILREAGVLDKLILNVNGTIAELKRRGWTWVNASQDYSAGDIVIWNGIPGITSHKHIGVVTGKNKAVNNKSGPRMPVETTIFNNVYSGTPRGVLGFLRPPEHV